MTFSASQDPEFAHFVALPRSMINEKGCSRRSVRILVETCHNSSTRELLLILGKSHCGLCLASLSCDSQFPLERVLSKQNTIYCVRVDLMNG